MQLEDREREREITCYFVYMIFGQVLLAWLLTAKVLYDLNPLQKALGLSLRGPTFVLSSSTLRGISTLR
jgi:hypothetical protein